MKGTIQAVVQIPLESIQCSDYDINAGLRRAKKHTDQCIICGRGMSISDNTKYVQLLENGNIISTKEDYENSMGFYPVGNDCAKKLIISFV